MFVVNSENVRELEIVYVFEKCSGIRNSSCIQEKFVNSKNVYIFEICFWWIEKMFTYSKMFTDSKYVCLKLRKSSHPQNMFADSENVCDFILCSRWIQETSRI